MKSLVLKRNKLSEVLSGGLSLVSVESKQNYNNKSLTDYIVTVLSIDCNETITVTCEEPVLNVKPMDKIDFEDVEVTFRGKGTAVFGANIMAELVMNIKAKKAISVGAVGNSKGN